MSGLHLTYRVWEHISGTFRFLDVEERVELKEQVKNIKFSCSVFFWAIAHFWSLFQGCDLTRMTGRELMLLCRHLAVEDGTNVDFGFRDTVDP